MKYSIAIFFILAAFVCKAQQAENIIIITTDGFRWQEVFRGMDSAIAKNKKYNIGDSAYLFEKYWSDNQEERRKKLLPFLWSRGIANGQLYGNRTLGNKVNTANPYWFSYPGYNEIMTGYADTTINSNDYPPNPNTTVLEFFNKQQKLKGKVAAFSAWEAFNRILNEQRSGFPVVAAFDTISAQLLTAQQKLFNAMLTDSYKPWNNEECLDVFTHYAAMDQLKTKKPKVLYIAYGETDEWAHAGKYRSYLDAAHQVDAWIKQLWDFVQNDQQYHNNTTFFITTDHGRGDKTKSEWTSHGSSIEGASEIWFAVLGPAIPVKGEMKGESQLYQKQFAQTIAKLMGFTFKADHPIANEIKLGVTD
jgi:arylsulfatase A-like enzyme